MRLLSFGFLASLACGTAPSASVCASDLFGEPTESTGLSSAQCNGQCGCDEQVWEPHRLTDAALEDLSQLILTNPAQPLSADPYEETPNLRPKDGVCATLLAADRRSYQLLSFDSEADAQAQGAQTTHTGACGQCSSLANLAVYARYPDLTDPVRDCGVDAIFAGLDDNIACLMELGFDEPCAQIWAFNTRHTREECLEPCLELLDAPHHTPDGSLNACIRCDEEVSGPVFKAIAGRTRRNSGLPSALCRPCESVARVSHSHWEAAL